MTRLHVAPCYPHASVLDVLAGCAERGGLRVALRTSKKLREASISYIPIKKNDVLCLTTFFYFNARPRSLDASRLRALRPQGLEASRPQVSRPRVSRTQCLTASGPRGLKASMPRGLEVSILNASSLNASRSRGLEASRPHDDAATHCAVLPARERVRLAGCAERGGLRVALGKSKKKVRSIDLTRDKKIMMSFALRRFLF